MIAVGVVLVVLGVGYCAAHQGAKITVAPAAQVVEPSGTPASAATADQSPDSSPVPAASVAATPTPSPSPTPRTGTVSGQFVQQEDTGWAQAEAYIGLDVSDPSNVSKVAWYLTNTKPSSLRYTQTTPAAGELYQYDWTTTGLKLGVYHWIAVVYDLNGNSQLVTNNNGDPFVDMSLQSHY